MRPRDVPFEWLAHLVVVPGRIGGVETRLVVDSGIGLDLVRTSLVERAGVRETGELLAAPRMSGVESTLPLAVASTVEVGGLERRDATVALLDLDGFGEAFADVGGFLSLGFFADAPVTVDHPGKRLVLETSDSLAARRAGAAVVPLALEWHGPALDAYAHLTLPNGEDVLVELDTGSDDLVLHERLLAAAGVDPADDGVRYEEGVDELGEPFARTFATVRGAVSLTAAPGSAQHDPPAIFQRLRFDGLVGTAFLRRFAVPWDLERGELLLG